VGVLHRDVWGGKEGGFELGILAAYREQVRVVVVVVVVVIVVVPVVVIVVVVVTRRLY